MSDLSSLIARLEAAEGPDRGIDRDIADTLGFGPDLSWARPNHQPGVHCMDVGDWTKGNRARSSERYTSSIDAAVSLAERVLPGWFFEHIGNDAIGEDSDTAWLGWTVELSPGMALGAQGQAKSLPVAICLATLRALDQKGGTE